MFALSAFANYIHKVREYHRVENELLKLDDKSLKDIGIVRSQINAVARSVFTEDHKDPRSA